MKSIRQVFAVITILAVASVLLIPIAARAGRGLANPIKTCMLRSASVGAAMLIYSDDYEGRMPPASYRLVNATGCDGNLAWPQLVRPYTEDWQALRCPNDPHANDADLSVSPCTGLPVTKLDQVEFAWAVRANRGYNWLFLAPFTGYSQNAIRTPDPTVLSRVNSLSATILIIDSINDRGASGNPLGGGTHVVDAPCVNSSASSTEIEYRPGSNTYSLRGGWQPSSSTSKFRYGGAWPWHTNDGSVLPAFRGLAFTAVLLDGHATALTPAKLTAGCSSIIPSTSSGVIGDTSLNLWDLK